MQNRSFVFIAVLLVLLQFACAPQNDTTAKEAENLALVRSLYEAAINQGNFEMFDELVAADVVEHEELPGFEPNREGVKQFFGMMRNAFPDLHFEVEEMFAAGDRVVARIVIHGTHEGNFMGIEGTGNEISVKGVDIFRVVDGQVVEHWGQTDSMAMMEQLGAMPSEM